MSSFSGTSPIRETKLLESVMIHALFLVPHLGLGALTFQHLDLNPRATSRGRIQDIPEHLADLSLETGCSAGLIYPNTIQHWLCHNSYLFTHFKGNWGNKCVISFP